MEYFETAREAVPEQFEPVVPCRQFETRPCVDIPTEENNRFRTIPCKPGECTRFPNLDSLGQI